jgi:hypothetical protein
MRCNVFKVMRMDFILNRTALLSNLVFMGAFMVFMSSWKEGASPGSYAVFSGLMMAFVPVMVVTREDKFKAMALGCSLPLTRKTIVGSRYLLALGAAVLGIGFAMTLGVLAPTSRLTASALLRPEIILRALSVTLLLIAILLPFTLRFGAFGLILVLASFQVLGIVALTLVKYTASSTDRRLVGTIVEGIGSLYQWAGPGGFYVMLTAFLILVLVASFYSSLWVFRRREL